MPRVLLCDKLETAGLEILRKAGVEIDNRPGLTGEALREALRQADGAIVRSSTQLTAAEFETPGKLRAVTRAGVGVDNIDVAAATRKGIVVMNTPGGNTISAAEHTIALLLALARHIPAAEASLKAGRWERPKFTGIQLAGKTLGVVGLGRIGREVARRAAGLDMKVVGFDPFLAVERAAQFGVEALQRLEDLLPRCDFITVHVPLTDATRLLIGAKEIAMLKPSCRVLNVARGGIVDENALADALKSGRIAGAAIDVFSVEPPPADLPLLHAPNVVVTPHLGAATVEAQENVAREAAQLIVDFLTKGSVQFAVNMAAIDQAEMADVRSYVDLARRLGLLQAQLAEGGIRRVTINYRGDVARRSTKLITAAFMAGLLDGCFDLPVNLVNAELLASERGIEVVATNNPKKGDFGTLIETEVIAAKPTTVSGTLFGNQFLRLVQLGPFRLDAYLDGTLVVLPHLDQPGLIGHIGTILGKHGINIARMAVGRETSQPGGEAVAILNVDSWPSDDARAQILSHSAIHTLIVVRLPAVRESPPWIN